MFLPLMINSDHTVQQPDILFVNNKEVKMQYTFPLENLQLDKRPFGYTRRTAPNTACWRGYAAYWEIINDKLYLKSVKRCNGDNQKPNSLDLSKFFSTNNLTYEMENDMIHANWFTGDLPIKSEDSEIALKSNKSINAKINNEPNVANIINGVVIEYKRFK